MFSNEQWLASSGSDFYNGVATTSARFDLGSSAKLSFTPSAGNKRTWTWSGWIKLSSLNAGSARIIFGQKDTYISTSQHKIWLNLRPAGASYYLVLDRLIRDSSGWMHVVVAIDTTQAVAANRVKWYINGVHDQNYFSGYDNAGAGVAQDFEASVNANLVHSIGAYNNSSNFWDGYLAEVNFVDGTAYGAESFGEFKNGVWIPIEPNVTYGQNGFRLQFKETGVGTASSSTIGADTSGEDNHWTSSGIVASDCAMPDSPENNFCTWNVIDAEGNANTFSEGNLKNLLAVQGSAEVSGATFAFNSGKWYWEEHMLASSGNASNVGVGIKSTIGFSDDYWMVRGNGGESDHNGAQASVSGLSWVTGDTVGIAVDMDAGTWTVSVNGTFISGNVHTGLSGTLTPFMYNSNSGDTHTFIANFGQDSSFAGNETAQGNTDGNDIGDFYYVPPSGYLALCTANLPEPTIGANSDTQADDHFNTVLYTGDGVDDHAITGVGFQPDFSWLKPRNQPWSHRLFDAVRGGDLVLLTDSTTAESTSGGTGGLKTFDSDGFTLGTGGSENASAVTFAAWNWKANGAGVSNTDGTITSTVSANTDAGFSIVSYTGDGTAGETVGHGLNVAPSFITVKRRNATGGWYTYHSANTSSPETDYLFLNTTAATADAASVWDDVAPTSDVFSLGVSAGVNGSGGTYVAYCFAEVDGYSKVGSYTGNGSSDGAFVFTGFAVKYLLVKRTDTAQNWIIFDAERNPYNPLGDKRLWTNSSSAENSSYSNLLDFTSNGFKCQNNNAEFNASGGTYIYIAFAEQPFKYANAR